MTNERRVQWLEAIEKLRKHYKKYPLDEVPPTYMKVVDKPCPLCEMADECEYCLWEIYEGMHCTAWDRPNGISFAFGLTQERLDRLDRWERKIREVSNAIK